MAMSYLLKGVEALYPKLDKPYRFDNAENRSVPCAATDDGAEYIVNLKVPYAIALPLRKAMAEAYNERKEAKWPKFEDNFGTPLEGSIKDKDAVFALKARIKAAYNGEPTRKPRQFDAQNNELGEGFQLTTGSIINVSVTFVPYSAKLGHGVSLRLAAVQVLKLAAANITSPFEKEDGFVSDNASPFTSSEEVEDAEFTEATDDDSEEWDEPEEPKKVKKKEGKSPPVKDDDDDLNSIINEWGDDD
jgi:hypothetical protein